MGVSLWLGLHRVDALSCLVHITHSILGTESFPYAPPHYLSTLPPKYTPDCP